MTTFLVSPTDRELARALDGILSPLCERYGADVLAASSRGLVGWQRKAFDDLLASLEDGRLGRELQALQTLPWPVLVVEGRPDYTSDGHLLSPYRSRWTKKQVRNVLRSCWYVHGVRVEETDSLEDTAAAIRELVDWLGKAVHRSLLVRPKTPARDGWGPDARSWARYFLQGFPGIGPERAEAIFDAVGVPLRWTVTQEELEQIPGIGPITSKRLWEALSCERDR